VGETDMTCKGQWPDPGSGTLQSWSSAVWFWPDSKKLDTL